jgi:hypothetical protein
VPPEQLTASTSLDVILYRLDQLDERLDELVHRPTYEARHQNLTDRVARLEVRLDQQSNERRRFAYGVAVALIPLALALALLVLTGVRVV